MGQRTQVLVIKENKDGERKNYFFHNQWGFGRVMYLGLIDLYMQEYSKDIFVDGYNFLDCKFKTNGKFYDCSEEVPEEVLNGADINNLESIQKVFEYGDNNNGGMVVYIKENKEKYEIADFLVGYLLGVSDESPENGKAFERWLSPEEYGLKNGGNAFSEESFVKIVRDFCNYFDIKFITD